MKLILKGFLCTFFLSLLLMQVGCRSVKRPSVDLESSNWDVFKLRYNAIYNIDKSLMQAEKGVMRQEIIWFPHTLFGEPDLQYEQDMKAAIVNMQEMLPQNANSNFKNSIFFKLGKAYYLIANYYTALEYFDLSTKNTLSPEVVLWKAKTLNRIDKAKDALYLIDHLKVDSLSKKNQSIYFAQKAEIYLRLNNSDSALFYLEKSLLGNPPKSHKPYWYLKLGEQLSSNNPNLAIEYLRNVARSNTAPSALKLQAEIELIRLKYSDIIQQVKEFKALHKKGYTIGLEWQLDYALANVYSENEIIDSAIMYLVQVVDRENTVSVLKSKSHWELVTLFVKEKKYDLAENHMAAIEPNHMQYLNSKARKLIANSTEWLLLLQNAEDTIHTPSTMYGLAKFYMNLGLKEEALAVVENLNIENSNFDYLHLSALLDTSQIDHLNTKYSELISQRQRFYTIYSDLYVQYQQDSFRNVIVGVERLIKDSTLFPQDQSRLAYLKAFAIGHSFSVDSLLKAFSEIMVTYNQDSAIVKRVNTHLDFIEKNKPAFTHRIVALEKSKIPVADLRATKQEDISPQFVSAIETQKIGTFIDYKLPELEPYYFVVLIDDMKINLAPTRYGIGQFIRTRFPRQGYGHMLSASGNSHQLIKVGLFENLQTAKEFESRILNLLPQIIKIGEKKYSTFVIPKSILDMSEEMSFINDYLKKYIEN